MIVVSGTSPLNYLILIDAIDVLPVLFAQVYVPPAVIQELQHSRTPDRIKHWVQSKPDWLHVTTPSLTAKLDPKLDLGEAEAIALAIELHAAAILIDERKGRRVANSHGFRTLGTITVLELAAEQNLLDLGEMLRTLGQTSFHCSQEILDAALQRDAARKLGL